MHLDVRTEGASQPQLGLLESRDRNVILSGGFGAGKTTGGAMKFFQLLGANPGTPGMVIAHNWSVLKGVVLRSINSRLPSKQKRRIIDPAGECYITFDGRTPIYMRSAHNPESIDSYDIGWVWGDELRHYRKLAYQYAIARCRIPCPRPQRVWTSTPSAGLIAEEFASGKKDRRMIVAPTITNAHNLAEGYVDDLRESYSAKMQKAYLDGEITVLEGSVYGAFDGSPGSQWIVDHDLKAGYHNETFLWIDPGIRRPAVVWARHTPKPNMRHCYTIIHQWMPENISTYRLAEQVNEINESMGIAIDHIWCDPAADARDQSTGFRSVDALRQIKCRRPSPMHMTTGPCAEISFGIERVDAILGDPEQGLRTRLFISSAAYALERTNKTNNRGVVKSLASYVYPEAKDGRPISDTPLKDGLHDHACDAIRYGVVGIYLTTDLRYRMHDERTDNARVKVA